MSSESFIESLAQVDWSPVIVSLRVAATATVIAVILGTALGYLLSQTAPRWRLWIESIVLLPLVLPPTVLGFFLLVLIGRQGAVGRMWEAIFGSPLIFTLKAAIIAACVSTIPMVARVVSAAFSGMDRQTTEAARIDGASGWSLFYHIQLPQLSGVLQAAATIAFARAVGDFGATLMVAGNLPGETQTASIAIYHLMNAGKDSQAFAMVLAVSLMSLIVLLVSHRRTTDLT